MTEEKWVTNTSCSWSSDSGFSYEKCQHRGLGACLRCRILWLVHLWRHGNRVWYLP